MVEMSYFISQNALTALASLNRGETVFHLLGVFASHCLPLGLLPGLFILSTYF